jgi:serine/threonine-protein kinase
VLWTHVNDLCDPFLDNPLSQNPNEKSEDTIYSDFKKFLSFKGRGIPRRILRGFNEHVQWNGENPFLAFSREDMRRFRFYANLYDVLQANEDQLLSKRYDDNTVERLDQRRLGLYYLTDWILQRGIAIFTAEEAVAASRRLSRMIAPSEDVAPEMVNALIKTLEAHDYIEMVTDVFSHVQAGDHLPTPTKRYHLVRRRLVEMGNLSGLFEKEAESLFTEKPSGIPADRYQILHLIGQGGMSQVYKALDNRTGRTVAIKRLPPYLSDDSEIRERLRREAKILASLQHPNIVHLYDVEMSTEQPYIVMEFIEGILLTALIKQKLLGDIDQILKLSKDLLQAVEYIHQQGIVWRDPKPSNIMITVDGRLVLLDFGISRDMSAIGITIMGRTIGTPAYMSPEQARGDQVDPRSDLYSIGVVLYQMVTGRLPYEANTPEGIIRNIIDNSIPPPSKFVYTPSKLEEVILKCLQKNPAERFQSASEVLAALPDATESADIAHLAQELIDFNRQIASREEEHTYVVSLASREEERTYGTSTDVNASRILPKSVGGRPPADAEPISQVLETEGVSLAAHEPFLILNGQVFVLDKSRVSLGRSASNDIVLDEPDASRYHAILTKYEDGYGIEDLNRVWLSF